MGKTVFRFLAAVAVLFASLGAYSAVPKNAAVMVYNTEDENISSDLSWLKNSVRDRLSANVSKYTGFKLIDNTNEKKVKELQKKFETGGYNEAEMQIEIGNLTPAKYAIFSVVRKAGSKYSLTVGVVDLSTGTNLFQDVSEGQKEYERLYDGAGCEIDKLTIKMCNALGVSLSSEQLWVLQHGESDLSSDERQKLAEQEAARYKEQIEALNKEISSSSTSSELSADSVRAKAEAQRAIIEEKLRTAEEKSKRLAEEKAKALEYEKILNEKSAKVKEERDRLAREAQEKADKARNQKMENASILSQIRIIEGKKQTLIGIRDDLHERLNEIDEQAEADIEAETDKIMNAELKISERKSDGTITSDALARRQNAVKNKEDSILAQAEKDKNDASAKPKSTMDSLRSGIYADYALLGTEKKPRTVSSLSDELQLSVGVWDGESHKWPVNVYLYSDNILLTQTSFEIEYTQFTGNAVPKIEDSDEKWDDYNDSVAMYDSLFSRGDKVLVCEMDYWAEPKDEDHPSEYKFGFSKLRVYNNVRGKMVSEMSLNSKRDFSMTPPYDIRTEEQIAAALKKEADRKALEEKRLAVEKARKDAKDEAARLKAEKEFREEQERIAREEEKAEKARQKEIEREEARRKQHGRSSILLVGDFYNYGDDNMILAGGLMITKKLGKHFYWGLNLTGGFNTYIYSQSSDSKSEPSADDLSYKDLGGETTLTFTGLLGMNWCFDEQIRVCLDGEAGLVNDSFGLCGNLTVEWFSPSVGWVLFGRYGVGWTPSECYTEQERFFDKYSIGLGITW
ncbi:hypothetical protein [Treponema saccharophilum]|uniref:hypothetical protein n=1 Tax=Treponema saccharophilum TaxID=165 RepID=UPI0038707584